MGRFRNMKTGAVVNVDDDTAATLVGYEPTEVKPESKKEPAKKSASRKK